MFCENSQRLNTPLITLIIKLETKNICRGVLFLVKLQAINSNITKNDSPPEVFLNFVRRLMVINWKTNHIFVITEVTCFIILYTFQFVETCLDIFNSVCCYLLSVFSIFPSKIYSLKCVGFASLAAEYTH